VAHVRSHILLQPTGLCSSKHNNTTTNQNITNPKCLVPAVMEVRVIPRKEFSLPCPPTTNAVRLLPKEAGELLSNQGGFETKGLMTNLCHVALSMTTTSTKTVERRRTMFSARSDAAPRVPALSISSDTSCNFLTDFTNSFHEQ
jgi:hypothetical protein